MYLFVDLPCFVVHTYYIYNLCVFYVRKQRARKKCLHFSFLASVNITFKDAYSSRMDNVSKFVYSAKVSINLFPGIYAWGMLKVVLSWGALAPPPHYF